MTSALSSPVLSASDGCHDEAGAAVSAADGGCLEPGPVDPVAYPVLRQLLFAIGRQPEPLD